MKFVSGTSRPPAWKVEATKRPVGMGEAHSISPPRVPTSSPLAHVVYLVPFRGYLDGSKSISARPSDPDKMTITALKAIIELHDYTDERLSSYSALQQ